MHRTRPNFKHVAELAGVSTSTVDRVLNDRGGVGEARRRKVVDAARRLGMNRVLPQAVRGSLHFDVIRTQEDGDYYRRLDAALQHVSGLLGPSIALHKSIWTGHDPAQLVRFLTKARHRRHGIILYARETPEIQQAIRQARTNGVPIVMMTTDIPHLTASGGDGQVAYVGIDNHAAGATAASMMGRFLHREGSVLLLAGSLDYAAHRQRAAGFSEVVRREFPHLHLLGPLQIDDDARRAERCVREQLLANEQVIGIYNTCAGSDGIARALAGRRGMPRPVWIAHEHTALHEQLLLDGAISLIIDQDPEAQALAGLQYLVNANHEGPAPTNLQPRFHLLTAHNAPRRPAPHG